MSIRIIDVFVKLRELLINNTELRLQLEKVHSHLHNHDKSIDLLFDYFDELNNKPATDELKKSIPKPTVVSGFKVGRKKEK